MGLGFMLGGITFLLATILGNLRVAGGRVQRALGARPGCDQGADERQPVPDVDDGNDDPRRRTRSFDLACDTVV